MLMGITESNSVIREKIRENNNAENGKSAFSIIYAQKPQELSNSPKIS